MLPFGGIRVQRVKRLHTVAPVKCCVPAEERITVKGTAGELPLQCFNVAATEAFEAVKQKDVVQKTKGPGPKPCRMRGVIMDPEGLKAARTLKQETDSRGAAVQLLAGKVIAPDRCVYTALKCSA